MRTPSNVYALRRHIALSYGTDSELQTPNTRRLISLQNEKSTLCSLNREKALIKGV